MRVRAALNVSRTHTLARPALGGRQSRDQDSVTIPGARRDLGKWNHGRTSNLNEQLPSRYVVGIDLGTTNSAVCYVDTEQQPWQVRAFAIPQLVAPGQIEARDTLPSFHYQPLESEATGPGPAASLAGAAAPLCGRRDGP